jgi:hypothetical protein
MFLLGFVHLTRYPSLTTFATSLAEPISHRSPAILYLHMQTSLQSHRKRPHIVSECSFPPQPERPKRIVLEHLTSVITLGPGLTASGRWGTAIQFAKAVDSENMLSPSKTILDRLPKETSVFSRCFPTPLSRVIIQFYLTSRRKDRRSESSS